MKNLIVELYDEHSPDEMKKIARVILSALRLQQVRARVYESEQTPKSE